MNREIPPLFKRKTVLSVFLFYGSKNLACGKPVYKKIHIKMLPGGFTDHMEIMPLFRKDLFT